MKISACNQIKVKIGGIEPGVPLVRGLDCLDGTPLLDIKPNRGEFTPQAVERSSEVSPKDNPGCPSTGGARSTCVDHLSG